MKEVERPEAAQVTIADRIRDAVRVDFGEEGFPEGKTPSATWLQRHDLLGDVLVQYGTDFGDQFEEIMSEEVGEGGEIVTGELFPPGLGKAKQLKIRIEKEDYWLGKHNFSVDGVGTGEIDLEGDTIVSHELFDGTRHSGEDTVGAYFKDIQHELLTREEEVDLAKRIDKGKEALRELELSGRDFSGTQEQELVDEIAVGRAARDVIVRHNLRLVVSRAMKKRNRGLPFIDLIQEGSTGLMVGVEGFDWRRGNKLSTYATQWIDQHMDRAIMNKTGEVRVPIHMKEQVNRMLRVRRVLEGELGRTPSEIEIAKKMDLSPKKVKALVEASFMQQSVSLDAPIMEGSDAETERYNFVADSAEGPEVLAIDKLDGIALTEAVDEVLRSVLHDPREREILRERSKYGGNKTLEELAPVFGLTRERVRQIEIKAVKKLTGNPRAIRLVRQQIRGEIDPVYSNRRRSPEDVMFGGGREFGKLEPLEEVIFGALEGRQVRITYCALYASVPFPEIARELELSKHVVESSFNRSRLKLWHELPMEHAKSDGYLKDRLRYFPLIDPSVVVGKFEKGGEHDLDREQKQIFERFFGLNGHSSSYDVKEIAASMYTTRKQVTEELMKAMAVIDPLEWD